LSYFIFINFVQRAKCLETVYLQHQHTEKWDADGRLLANWRNWRNRRWF